MNFQSVLIYNAVALLLVALTFGLAAKHRLALLYLIIGLTIGLTVHFSLLSDHSLLEWMEFIKLMGLLPLGLGSVVGFSLLNPSRQKKELAWFTVFINVAVVGNILMMVLTPAFETYRGVSSRLVCILLSVWLLQEMAKVRWRTVHYDSGFFIFNASPLPWVLCHAAYRIALVSLPSFDSFHYVLMEPLSLAVMFLFYRMHDRKYPMSFYFGYADTLVVSAMAVCSRLFYFAGDEVPGLSRGQTFQYDLDLIFVSLHAVASCVAICAIVKTYQRSPAKV